MPHAPDQSNPHTHTTPNAAATHHIPHAVALTEESIHRPGGIVGVIAGPVLGVAAWALLQWLAPGLPEGGRRAAAVLVWMAVWWLAEVVPLGITALLPLVLMPILGVLSVKDAASPYADRIIFLFMGGFILALAMERWELHKRIALVVMLMVGTGPKRLVLGVMCATALLSMWVSNTATALMMMPIALGITAMLEGNANVPLTRPRHGSQGNLGIAMVLGVAAAASIGGLGTPIGSPPNAVLTSYLDRSLNHSIGFGNWMLAGVLFVAAFIPLAWAYLVFVACRVPSQGAGGEGAASAREHLRRQYAALGPVSRGEWGVMVCFGLTVAGWVLREPLILLLESRGSPAAAYIKANVDDAAIAIIGGLLAFVWPVSVRHKRYVMDWATFRRMPWDILLLFGGGLCLAAGVQASGLDKALGGELSGLAGWPVWLVVLVCCTISVFVSEFTSNVAQANVFYPILGGVAASAGLDPMVLLFPCCLSLSCAFMLPMGTPPNAIAFATGRVTMKRFALAGLGLNLLGIVLVMLLTLLVLPHVPGMRMR
jgi:sodium-dependent dicarboxylate transporter 2/3/5